GGMMESTFIGEAVVSAVGVAHDARCERGMEERGVEHRLLRRCSAFDPDAAEIVTPGGFGVRADGVEVPVWLFGGEIALRFGEAGEGGADADEAALRGAGGERDVSADAIAAGALLLSALGFGGGAPGVEVSDRLIEADDKVAVEAGGLACFLVDADDR